MEMRSEEVYIIKVYNNVGRSISEVGRILFKKKGSFTNNFTCIRNSSAGSPIIREKSFTHLTAKNDIQKS